MPASVVFTNVDGPMMLYGMLAILNFDCTTIT